MWKHLQGYQTRWQIHKIYNKLTYKSIITKLIKRKSLIDHTKMPYSRYMQLHCLRLWEYAIAIVESVVDSRMNVLDAGSTGTIFFVLFGISEV
jgi:hypothetical protein